MTLTPEQLVSVYAIVTGEMFGQVPSREFLAGLRAALEGSPRRAREETTRGVVEMLSEATQLADERLAKIDAALADIGLPGLQAVVDEFEKVELSLVPSVLSRGRIISEAECEAVTRALDDMTWVLTDDQRVQLGTMLNRYEDR